MDKLKVLVSLITEDNNYQLEQAASAQAAARKLGASVQIIYSGNDAVQQTQQILNFIQDPSQRPDAILAEPVGTGMAQIAKAAVTAGIAWAIVNTDVDYVSQLRQHALVPVFSILSDHAAIGKIQGQQIAPSSGMRAAFSISKAPPFTTWPKSVRRACSKPPQVNVKTLKGDGRRTAIITPSNRGCLSARPGNSMSA